MVDKYDVLENIIYMYILSGHDFTQTWEIYADTTNTYQQVPLPWFSSEFGREVLLTLTHLMKS